MSLLIRAACQGTNPCLLLSSVHRVRAPLLRHGQAKSSRLATCQTTHRCLCSQTALPRVFKTDNMTSASQLIYNNRLLNFLHQGVFKWSLLPFYAVSVYLFTIGVYGDGQTAADGFARAGFKRPETVKWKFFAFTGFLVAIIALNKKSFIRIYYTPSTGAYTGIQGKWSSGLVQTEFMQYQVTSREHQARSVRLIQGNVSVKTYPLYLWPRWFANEGAYKQFHSIRK